MNCRQRERAERAETELRTAHEMRKALADKVTAQQAVQQCRIRVLEDQVEKRETSRCAILELERHIEAMAEEMQDKEEVQERTMREIDRLDECVRCAQASLELAKVSVLETGWRAEMEKEEESRRLVQERAMVDAQNSADRMRLLQAVSDLESALV